MPGRRYRIVTVGPEVGQGVTKSHYVNVSTVAKQNGGDAPYCMPNELICAEIGQFLRLPIPPFAIVSESDPKAEPWFASLDFNLGGGTLPPIDPEQCMEMLPELSTGVLLFDILITNSDRHRGNLSMDTNATPAQMTVYDHSHAFLGREAGQAVSRLSHMQQRLGVTGPPGTTGGNRHCFLDLVTSTKYFDKWIDRIAKIPHFLIEEVCQEASNLGISTQEAEQAEQSLKYRRDNFIQIVSDHKADFSGMTQWGLGW